MADASDLQLSFLDGPTLAFVTVCIVALLGLFLILAWLQQRDMRTRLVGFGLSDWRLIACALGGAEPSGSSCHAKCLSR